MFHAVSRLGHTGKLKHVAKYREARESLVTCIIAAAPRQCHTSSDVERAAKSVSRFGIHFAAMLVTCVAVMARSSAPAIVPAISRCCFRNQKCLQR